MSGTVNYNYLAEDPTRPMSDTISKWQGVQKNALDIQGQLADKAWGQTLQAATDPNTGVVDYGKAKAAAAQNPTIASGMQRALTSASALTNEQINQGSAMYNNVTRASMSVMNDPSDENLEAQRQATLRQFPGQAQSINAEFDAAKNMSQPDRVKWAYSHGVGALSAHDAMVRSPFGETASTDIGGTQQPLTTRQGTPWTQPGQTVGPGVTRGAPPGTVIPGGHWEADGHGGKVWVSGQVPASTIAPGGQPVSGQPGTNSTAPPPPPAHSNVRIPSPGAYNPPAATAPPPGPQGLNVPPAGGNVQIASAGPNFVPSSTAAAAPPSGAVASDVAAIQGGRTNAAAAPSGGVRTAQNYPPAGTVLSPSVIQTPQGPFIPSGPPSGYTEQLNNDIKARTDASLAAGDQRKNLQAGENAFEALKLAGNYTGSGTGTAAALYGWLEARAPQFLVPQGTMTDTAWRQVLAKNLLRFAQESGLRMNTDLGMSEALKGTANADTILPNANREILINDIGMARQRLAQTQLMPTPSGDGAVVNHFRTYTSDTDSRAFAWDLYSGPERKAIEAEVAKDKSGKAEQRLNKGLEDAAKAGLIKLPGQSQAAPPPSTGPAASPGPFAAAAPNALLTASSGGPANALAA